MITLDKVKLYAQSWYDSTQYDLLIDDIILNAEAYINELISWKHVPKTYTFKQIAQIEVDNKVYLEKNPITEIVEISVDDEIVEDFEVDNYAGVILLKCFNNCAYLKKNAIVEYGVGGIAQDYPLAIDNIILDLVLKKLNFAINNAQGYQNNQIGSDIKFTFMFELTEEQKYTIKKYLN